MIYLLMQEMTIKSRQPLVGTIIHVVNGFTSGMSVIYTRYIYSYWVPWQAIILGVICVATIAMFFVPESPKYLVAKKRYDEARQVLLKIANVNKKKVNLNEIVFEAEVLEPGFNLKHNKYDMNNTFTSLGSGDENKNQLFESSVKDSLAVIGSPMRRVAEDRKMTGSITDLIRIKRHAINLALLIYMWIQNTFCLTMINFYTKYIKGDKYINMLANSLVEIPAYALGGILIYYLGVKRTTYIGTIISLVGGTLLIIYGNPDPDVGPKLPDYAFVFIVLSAKGGILILINTTYIATATMFPPIFSGAAFGICNTFAKSVASTGPIAAELMHPIPASLFTSLTAVVLPIAYFL